jgi:hypothetical protein
MAPPSSTIPPAGFGTLTAEIGTVRAAGSGGGETGACTVDDGRGVDDEGEAESAATRDLFGVAPAGKAEMLAGGADPHPATRIMAVTAAAYERGLKASRATSPMAEPLFSGQTDRTAPGVRLRGGV